MLRGHIPDRVLADRQHRAALRQRLERVVRVRTRNAGRLCDLVRRRRALQQQLHVDTRLVLGEAEPPQILRSEEHTSELQSLMRNSYAVFCWKQKKAPNENA